MNLIAFGDQTRGFGEAGWHCLVQLKSDPLGATFEMSRRRRTVAYLAEQAGVAPEFALELMREAGVGVARTKDVIATSVLHAAHVALDLARPRKEKREALKPVEPEASAESAPTSAKRGRKKKKVRADSIIGRRQPLSYLGYADVKHIHWVLVEDFRASRDPIEPPGVKSEDLLHSGLARCQTSLGEDFKYPTPAMGGAALLHSIVLNHAFHNGNKRTGLVALLVFLDINGWSLHVDEDQLFDFLLKIASHQLTAELSPGRFGADAEVLEMARWLNRNIRRTAAERRAFKFHDLRSLLLKHGCILGHARGSGNRIVIARGPLRTRIWYGGEGRDVAPNTIVKIRADLELDYEHGYDDWTFFNAEERVPEFVTRYRKTLDRLAKT